MNLPSKIELTKREREVLEYMRRDIDTLGADENNELVYSRGGGWMIGLERVGGKTALSLLRKVLVSECQYSDESTTRYHINSSGIRALDGIEPVYET